MSQIQKKFIADNAIDGSKIRLKNNETLRARNAAGTGDIDILKVASDDSLEFQQQPRAGSALAVPSSPKDYATIEYIQNVIQGKSDAKDAVHALADANTALTGSAPLTIDGVNLGAATATPPKRVALTGQTDASENGIYNYSVSGGNYTLARAADFADGSVTHGAYFLVTGGTTYSGYEVILTTDDPIVIDTTDLAFAKYPSVLSLTAGDMLTKVGNDFSIDLHSTSGLESSNSGNPTGQLRIRPDQAGAEKDKSTTLDSGTNALIAKRARREVFTLNSTDITNQYIDLQNVATDGSISFGVAGAGEQIQGVDFTVNYTGGSGSKTRIAFAGGLASTGVSELVSGDVVQVTYEAF